jgi:hypothetical protein
MSNVVSLFPRAEDGGENLNEIREGAERDDLITAWAETWAAAAKLAVAFRQLSEHLDAVDHLIGGVEDHEIRERLTRQAIDNRESLMKGISAISKNIAKLKNMRPRLGTDRAKPA